MKKVLLIIILLGLTNSICLGITDNTIQISERDKKLYTLRKNPEFGFYSGNMALYNADFTRKAENFLKKGNYEKANKYINLALYYYEQNPLTYIVKAEIDLNNNKIDSAKLNYQKACDIRESNIRIDKNGKEYIEYDSQLYSSYTNSTLWERIAKGRAKIALKENNLQAANKIIDYITDNWVYLDKEIFKIKSEILKAEGNKELSIIYENTFNTLSLTDNLDENNPNDAEAYYQRASAYHNVGEDEFALNAIKKAINLKQDSRYFLLKYQLVKNDSEKLDMLNYAIKLNPKQSEAYLERANLFYHHNERFENAINDYKKVIEIDNLDETDFAEEIGTCYYKLGDYQKAYEYYSKSIDCLGLKGDTLYSMGKYKEALNIYNSILNNPDYNKSNVLYMIASCKENLGNKQGALQDYTKAINMGNPDYYYDRGLVYYNLKNYQKALQDFNLYISKVGESRESIFYRGKCYMALGNYQKALQDFYGGIYNVDALYSEAYCRYKIGDRIGARKLLYRIERNNEFMLEDMETYQKAVKLLHSI